MPAGSGTNWTGLPASGSRRRGEGARFTMFGPGAMPTSWRTWTSTSRPTSMRFCRWSRRWCPATATWRSALVSPAAPTSFAGRKRELISRSYNRVLRTLLATRFSDAQCGFKAIRADRARQLLPLVKDRGWFFDTELLVLAERAACGSTRCPSTGSRTQIRASTSSRRHERTCVGVWRLLRDLRPGQMRLARSAHEPRTPNVRLAGRCVSWRSGSRARLRTRSCISFFRTGMSGQAANAHGAPAHGDRQHGRESSVHVRNPGPPHTHCGTRRRAWPSSPWHWR